MCGICMCYAVPLCACTNQCYAVPLPLMSGTEFGYGAAEFPVLKPGVVLPVCPVATAPRRYSHNSQGRPLSQCYACPTPSPAGEKQVMLNLFTTPRCPALTARTCCVLSMRLDVRNGAVLSSRISCYASARH
eukprot:3079019-Rhodomonas_salina.2